MAAFHYRDEQKIQQFTTVEANAVKFVSTHVLDEEAEADHNLRLIVSHFAGPFKFAVFDSASYGALIRGICVPRFRPAEAPNWRHELVTFIKAYRAAYPGWANGGYNTQSHGRTPLLVNFHGLDPSFPDEAVSEGPAARITRFQVQRRLYGVGMNTDLTTQDPAIEAYTD